MILKAVLSTFILVFIFTFMNCEIGSDVTGNNKPDTTDTSTPPNAEFMKPNIYIYPVNKIELDVSIRFPNGGSITASVPDYKGGWHIIVDSTGLINNKYRFLFYESDVPNLCQYEKGWIVNGKSLAAFFNKNLQETGFLHDEINDFIDYWIPLIDSAPSYAIYPQYSKELEKMIQIRFSKMPDNILRLSYVIKKIMNPELNIPEPTIPQFKRKGFTVTEWGVILQ